MSLLNVLIGLILACLAAWLLSFFLPIWAAVLIVVVVLLVGFHGAR